MSIFGKRNSTTETFSAPVYEGYGVEVNGDILALQESWEDQLAIMEALHSLSMEEIALNGDIRVLEESGATASEIDARYDEYEAVTESMAKNAWQKIKEFFQKLWGKIKAFFSSVVRTFDGVFKSSEAFVKKYEAQIKKLNLRGYEYKMHTYTNIDEAGFMSMDVKANTAKLLDVALQSATRANTGKEIENLTSHIEEMRENREDDLNKYRAEVVGSSGSLTGEQFHEELYGMFRNGATGKEDAKEQSVDAGKLMDVIKNAKDAKKKADEFAKKTDAEFGKIIKTISDIESKLSSGEAKNDHYEVKTGEKSTRNVKAEGVNKVIEALRIYSSSFSSQKDIQMTVFRAWKDAFNERNSVYKSALVGAFRHKAEK